MARLLRPTAPGIGVTLTPEMEARYPFDDTAVYSCALIDFGPPPDEYWQHDKGTAQLTMTTTGISFALNGARRCKEWSPTVNPMR